MAYMVVLFLLMVLVLVPQWWVKRVFVDYSKNRDDFPGTGAQFAEHIIAEFKVNNAVVTSGDQSNHFDPEKKAIVLSSEYYSGKSLTAITVAAHEIGHLIQLEQNNKWFQLRMVLVRWANKMDKIGIIAVFLMPFGAMFTRSPIITLLLLGLGFSGMLMNVVAHLVTLPMELDASFGKALPLLKAGKYIREEDEAGVRKILWAAALTYLAAALSGLLNLTRWLRVLRR
ncbi:zinc metallopeptidase [bacterium]|nr:zinc metallopeptidase [bacterium]